MEDKPRTSKQVLVVRKDLNMRKGKMCAQAAHASMKVLLDLMPKGSYRASEPKFVGGPPEIPEKAGFLSEADLTRHYQTRLLMVEKGSAMADWLDGIFTKITVSVNSEAALLGVYEAALAAKLPCALIQDAGKTEFGGVPTYTAVAVGPAWNYEVDPITGHLPLL